MPDAVRGRRPLWSTFPTRSLSNTCRTAADGTRGRVRNSAGPIRRCRRAEPVVRRAYRELEPAAAKVGGLADHPVHRIERVREGRPAARCSVADRVARAHNCVVFAAYAGPIVIAGAP